ncbi:hypothetical protein GQ55_6G175800 [Panicum hallii var. hallii]|uniref:Uncharacterized protein n=1 Tax=Panicum hallii var. hallii TaxID=1504633 RepID=A0A2T7D6X1_9POAL|nr:hypothetical protein GQ55_6G175800 [Panicum hallii var. hallii]
MAAFPPPRECASCSAPTCSLSLAPLHHLPPLSLPLTPAINGHPSSIAAPCRPLPFLPLPIKGELRAALHPVSLLRSLLALVLQRHHKAVVPYKGRRADLLAGAVSTDETHRTR